MEDFRLTTETIKGFAALFQQSYMRKLRLYINNIYKLNESFCISFIKMFQMESLFLTGIKMDIEGHHFSIVFYKDYKHFLELGKHKIFFENHYAIMSIVCNDYGYLHLLEQVKMQIISRN